MQATILENRTQKVTDFKKFHISDGVLVFEDYEAYNVAYYNLENFSDFLASYSRSSQDFKSLETIYEDIHNTVWDFGEDEESKVFAYIEENSKYVYIEESEDGDSELKNVTDIRQNNLANKDFIFKIGDMTYDIRELQDQILDQYSLTKMNCGQELEVTVTNDNNGCRRDRRGTIRVRAVRDDLTPPGTGTDGACSAQVQVRLKGQRKRVCIWVNYQTALRFIGTPVASAVFPAFGGGTTTVSGPGWSGPMSCADCSDITLIAPSNSSNLATVGCSGEFFITAARVTGTTRGLNGANIDVVCF